METDNPFQINSRVRVTPRTSLEYTIYIDDDIGPPSEYRDETQILLNASPDDDITMVINSGGGRVDTALQLVEAMNYSPANITAVITGNCMSAATLIALTAQQVLVLDSAEIMCHQAKAGAFGNVNNMFDQSSFTNKQVTKMIDKFYTGFLTKKEIEELKLGKEFWVDAEEARERFTSRQKYLKAEYIKIQKKDKKQKENQQVAVSEE